MSICGCHWTSERSTIIPTINGHCHTVFQGKSCVFVYLDDILVASSSPHEHIQDLKTVCNRLQQYGLTIRLEKCLFGVSEIDFLGHLISKDGSVPLPTNVKPISEFPKPINVKSLQEFLGMINFYHRFIPNAATILRPLYHALRGKTQKELIIGLKACTIPSPVPNQPCAMPLCLHTQSHLCKGVFKGGGGFRGFKPPPKFSDFF